MDAKGHVLIRKWVETGEAEILGLIRSIEGYKELAFEESTLSQWLYVLLKNKVDELVVANPTVFTKSGAAKTDFLDAAELADLLRANRLKSVFHSADERVGGADRTLGSLLKENQAVVDTCCQTRRFMRYCYSRG